MRLTIFSSTYNRVRTLPRLYESLLRQGCGDFEWLVVDDGSTDSTRQLVEGYIAEGRIPIRYIYKKNGGLYTGYNTAYANIDSELCMCVDSDDYLPDGVVPRILDKWDREGGDRYAGILGLDFYASTGQPIGGCFPEDMRECWFMDLYSKKLHRADTKQVMRTALMREVAPMRGFRGEKFFNPVYLLLQVCDRKPLLVMNENLCFVDYQPDSMSANMWKQYWQSPRSFAKMRWLELRLKHNTLPNRLRSLAHLLLESLLASVKCLTQIGKDKERFYVQLITKQ